MVIEIPEVRIMAPNGIVYDAARCTARFGRTKFAEQMLAAAKLRANRKHRSAECYIFQIPKLVFFVEVFGLTDLALRYIRCCAFVIYLMILDDYRFVLPTLKPIQNSVHIDLAYNNAMSYSF